MLTLNLPSQMSVKQVYRRMHGAFRAHNIPLQSMLFNRLCFECGTQNAITMANSVHESVRYTMSSNIDWLSSGLLLFTSKSVAHQPVRLFMAIKRNNENRIRKQDEALNLSADSSF